MKRKSIVVLSVFFILGTILVLYALHRHKLSSGRQDNAGIKISGTDECELMLNGDDPYTGAKKAYAMRQYIHCVLSLEDTGRCYLKYRQEIKDCLAKRHETMTDDQIRIHLTGGIMEEKCRDIEAACTPPKTQNSDNASNDEIDAYLKNRCIPKMRQECSDLNYMP